MLRIYEDFYHWYYGKIKLKAVVAFLCIAFPYLYYFSIWGPAVLETSRGLVLLSDSFLNLTSLYFAAPYLSILFLFIIIIFYNNILMKIAIIGIQPIMVLTQMGVLMGFTSYFDILYFLPQLLLTGLVIWIAIKTRPIRKKSKYVLEGRNT